MTLPKYIFPLLVLSSVHLWSSLCSGHMSFTHSYKISRMKIRKSVHLLEIVFHMDSLVSGIKQYPHRRCYFSCTKTCWINPFLFSSSFPPIFFTVSQDFCWPLALISFDPDTCYVSCKLSPQLTKPDCWPLLLRDLGVRKITQTAWHHSRSR